MTTQVFYRTDDKLFYQIQFRTDPVTGVISKIALQLDTETSQKLLVERPKDVEFVHEDDVGLCEVYANLDTDSDGFYYGENCQYDKSTGLRHMLNGLKKLDENKDSNGRAGDILSMIRNRKNNDNTDNN